MHASFASIVVAWEIVNKRQFPSDKPYAQAAQELKDAGHLALLVACNHKNVVTLYEYKDTSAQIAELTRLFPSLKSKYPHIFET